jgi:hypothetical protein
MLTEAMSASKAKGRGDRPAIDPSQPLFPRLAARPLEEWAQLPVLAERRAIVDLIKRNRVLVLTVCFPRPSLRPILPALAPHLSSAAS